jgi:hypothetical protein
MNKANVFRSSEFHMDENDILHMLFLDEDGVQIDVDLWNVDTDTETLPDTPTSLPASDITDSSFTANWYFNENTTGYRLDVSTSSTFATYVGIYQNLDVGNVNSYDIIGLGAGSSYYYRLRAYNDFGDSGNSNTISCKVILVSNDWFLPSKDELNEMKVVLKDYGVGGFQNEDYWCSSEPPVNAAYYLHFGTGVLSYTSDKSNLHKVRACRAFNSTTIYALREIGPAGGFVFYKNGNDYLEAAPIDQSNNYLWSNVALFLMTTDTIIGSGQANTTAIIGQVGHTDSAAKLCNDLVYTG